jgi:hypothetical protein
MGRGREAAMSNVMQPAAGTQGRAGSLWVRLRQKRQAASHVNTLNGSRKKTYQKQGEGNLSKNGNKNYSLSLRKLGIEFVRAEQSNGLIRLYGRPKVDRDTLMERFRRIKIDSENIRVYKEYLLKNKNLAVGTVIEFPEESEHYSLGVLSQVARDTVKYVDEVPLPDSAERHPQMPFNPGAWNGQKGAHPIKVPR